MKKIQNIVFLSAAFLWAPTPFASAADVAAYDNPFAGFYMGIHAGYGWAAVDEDYASDLEVLPVQVGQTAEPQRIDAISGNYSLDASGALLGAQAGANFVMSNGLLIGAEVNGSWAAMGGDTSFPWATPYSPFGSEADISAKISALGLAQAKLGWASETFAVYGLGGLALAQFQRDANIEGGLNPCINGCLVLPADVFVGSPSGNSNLDEALAGWTVGAGLDVMVADNVSLGLAYNYARFEYDDSFGLDTYLAATVSYVNGGSPSNEVETSGHVDVHVVKATLNYHF